MEYYSAIKRSKIESVVVRWMNLDSVIQSEVSQKEKNNYHLLMHIYGLKKNATDEPIHSNLTILCVDSFFVVVRVKQENQELLYQVLLLAAL